jgi:hypothetical protein
MPKPKKNASSTSVSATGKKKPAAPKEPKDKKKGGGPAVGGGVNFQAIVIAIVGASILRGTRLGWLDGIVQDQPVAASAESGGPGDDIRVELIDGSVLEIQVKKGLKRNAELWASLETMAVAIDKRQLDYGVLVVAPDSSDTVCYDLAKVIECIGQGQYQQGNAGDDHLEGKKSIGDDFAGRLAGLGVEVKRVCQSLRIQVVQGLASDSADIRTAKEALRLVCRREDQVDAAWNAMYRRAVQLMEQSGRWNLHDLVRLLTSENIDLRPGDFPASVLDRLTKWTLETNTHFQITGTRKPLPIKGLLTIRIEQTPFETSQAEDAATALSRYHQVQSRLYDNEKTFDGAWTARFKNHAVIVAGPGLGKSTMLKQLAHQYAADGYPVLKVSLKPVAAALRNGTAFSDAVFSHALSGTSVSRVECERAEIGSHLVLLADGLDDCGAEHGAVAEELQRFATGHPAARVVVTTRPVGYKSVALSAWPHYRLLPPKKFLGAINLGHLVETAADEEKLKAQAQDIALRELQNTPAANTIEESPQLLGMAASLIIRHRGLPKTRLQIYESLIQLFEEQLPEGNLTNSPSLLVARKVLSIIAWLLVEDPLSTTTQLVNSCSIVLSPELDRPPLAMAETVEGALAIWERLGLVERVHHDGVSLLTFIHKTFTEFVAARYLFEMSEANRVKELSRVIDLASWSEVMGFVAEFGLSSEVVRLYVDRRGMGYSGQLGHALALVGNSNSQISAELIKELVDLAFEEVENGNKSMFRLGVTLAGLASKEPDIVGSSAATRLYSTDPGVKLVAWATAVRCGPDYFDPDAITTEFKELLDHVRKSAKEVPEDAVPFRVRNDQILIRHIALAALRAQAAEQLKSFLEIDLSAPILHTGAFISKVEEILQSCAVDFRPRWMNDYTSRFNVTVQIDQWRQASRGMLFALAEAVAPEPGPATARGLGPPFLQFAALLSIIDVGESNREDWTENFDKQALQVTLKALVQVSSLDTRVVADEASEILQRLIADPRLGLLDLGLPNVDVPEPDWSKITPDGDASTLRQALKKAQHHPAEGIAQVATHLLKALDANGYASR